MKEVGDDVETFFEGRVTLWSGDCLSVLSCLPDCSADSCVTDPPYHLTSIVKRFGGENAAPAKTYETGAYGGGFDPDGKGTGAAFARMSKGFMGKQWDGGDIAFRPEVWAQVFRVLKPGGYLLAFGGTRTYHRMACAIEDAGFDVRDMISFLYATGFPKSHDVGKKLDAQEKRCTCDSHMRDVPSGLVAAEPLPSRQEQDLLGNVRGDCDQPKEQGATVSPKSSDNNSLRSVRYGENYAAGLGAKRTEEHILQSVVSGESDIWPGAHQTFPQGSRGLDGSERGIGQDQNDRPDEPGMEGRGDVSEASRKLRERSLHPVSGESTFDGANGRVRDGTSLGHGTMDQAGSDQSGMRPSFGSQAAEQQSYEPGTVAGQSKPQERGAWSHCRGCGKPMVPDGLGTALKPAMELICMARKPLSEGTVAANVLEWGTGAINIDGCRVGTGEDKGVWPITQRRHDDVTFTLPPTETDTTKGRWPANVIHDGSEEVTAAFPDTAPSNIGKPRGAASGDGWGMTATGAEYNDSGSAARFFYSAKADSFDRIGSKHPTVKPVDLMQYLVRLVTPKGGTILDPFSGTGTTGEAAWREGMRAVLIEREAEYQADIRRRMALCLAGPDERAREAAKALQRDRPVDAGPLFLQIRPPVAPSAQNEPAGSPPNLEDIPDFLLRKPYNGHADFAASYSHCLAAVRERVANGGEPWVPKK